MLSALRGDVPDVTPCSFMIFRSLRRRCANDAEFVEQQLAMGLDAVAHVGYLRPSLHPDARMKTWVERKDGQTLYCRRIDTPKGPLTQQVAQQEGWPADTEFWMFNDWIVPRAREPLVKPEQDLEKLPYVLGAFRAEDVAALRESARMARDLAERRQILLVGGWSSSYSLRAGDDGVMGADAMAWLSGYVEVMMLSLTRPDVIQEYMRIIHEWNRRQIEIYLDVTEAEVIIRRAWYETTEFWTPRAYRTIIAPTLKKETELVHQAGKKYGYIITSAFMPVLDDILDSGVDVLIGLDPKEGKGTDLQAVKKKFTAMKKCLWGGVSGAVTVETGTEQETEEAVIQALQVLGQGGGFILSPVDNVREDTPQAWKNTHQFIDTWKKHRADFI